MASGAVVHTLPAQPARITSLALNPDNVAQLITTSLCGSIRFWDYEEGVQVRAGSLGVPIVAAAVHPANANAIVVAVPSDAASGRVDEIWLVDVAQTQAKAALVRKQRVLFTLKLACISVVWSPNARFIVAGGAKKELKVYQLHTSSVRETRVKVGISALDVSPADGVVAVGDKSGRITLWRCLSKKAAGRPLHKLSLIHI